LRTSKQMRLTLVLVLALFTFMLNAEERTFTVRDSIEMNTLSDPETLERDGQAKFSPDGKHFLVVTTRGILQSDQLESCLMVFDTSSISFVKHESAQLAGPPKCAAKLAATPIVEEGATTYASIITEARWSVDSKSIFFLGQGQQGDNYLYRVDIRIGKPQQLSPTGYNVIRFDCARKAVVYVVSQTSALDDGPGQTINRDARDVTGIDLSAILFPKTRATGDRHLEVWANEGDRRPTMIAPIPRSLNGNADLDHVVLSISPDGTKAVTLVPVTSVPHQWDSYEPYEGFERFKIHAENPDRSAITIHVFPLKQYALIDLDKKRMMPLVDAPTGDALGYFDSLKAVWSEDGRRLLLTNTFMPIGGAGTEGPDHPLRSCAVASIDLAQRITRCIVPARSQAIGAWHLQGVSFGVDSDEVLATFATSQQKPAIERYQDTARGWVGPSNVPDRPIISKSSQMIEVHIRQGLNDPPTLTAKSLATGEEVRVWDPNPGLKKISYGEASLYHWKDSSGYEWSGILVKPVGYTKGERYPLVIQTHGFRDWAFVTDGIFPTAMAARPLASAGIAVLQTSRRYDVQGTPQEAGIEAGQFESAVRQLSEDGLIDPKRVGAVGFSSTCFNVESTLILKPMLFRAATIADGVDYSYMQYHLFSSPGIAAAFEKTNDGKPVGVEGLKKWLMLAPGFRLDEVRTPLRIEGHGEGSPLSEWEIYSSLQLQGKPVDLVYIPDGLHILQKPLERMASQQGNVDWFRFWLQDYQDPDPLKIDQYKRWEHLREMRDADDKALAGQPPAPTITPN
jgi:dipeptidyl aminopeptidase/acylaminoacyl peptidase